MNFFLIQARAALLGALLLGPTLSAQTAGSVSLTATLSDTGAGPAHWTVVWVTNATTGAFVRTIRRQGPSYKSHWNNHCSTWYAAVAANATNYTVALDGYTSATATNYAAPNSPFTQTWDCKDASGVTVPDGNYKLWIQYSEDDDIQQGPVTTSGLLWAKGPAASSVTPPNQAPNFTNMSIDWTPAVVAAAPEIVVEQPAGTNIADAGSRDFGSVTVGASAPLTFTIKNTGNANLTGLTITKDGANPGDFTVTSSPVAPVAGPSGTTTFTVSFAPTAAGPRSAAIHIANNDSDEAPFDINLTGTGMAAAAPEIVVEQPAGTNIADAGSRDFGSVTVGASAPLTFTIKNTGNANLTGLTITKDGTNPGDFTVTSSPVAPVAGPSGTTTFTVSFAPAAAGPRSAAIHIANNDSDEAPFDINLAGTGTSLVVSAPAITTHPVSTAVTSGGTATLNVGASGTSPTFQWYLGVSGDTTTPIQGAIGNSFTTPALSTAATYWVRASNTAGVADSNAATVSISSFVLTTSGIHGTITGAGSYGVMTQATLSATPDPGYIFSGWTGDASGTTNPLSLLMDSNKNVGASFSLDANPTDPFAICFVGTVIEPRVGNQITLDLKRLTSTGQTVRLLGKLPTGLTFSAATGLVSGTITGKPGTYQIRVQILQGQTILRTIAFPITVLAFPSSLIGDYESLLEDADSVPCGAFRISITAANRWSATLESAGAKKRMAKGTFILAQGFPVAPITAVFPASSGAPAVTVNLSIDGGSPNITGSYNGGTLRGFRLSSGDRNFPEAATYSLVFDAGVQDGITVPAGLGWMKGKVGKQGLGIFNGFLGDGAPASLTLRLSPSGQAVLWAQPYTNNKSYVGGIVTLGNLGQPVNGNPKLTDTLWWYKVADSRTLSYPGGFPAMPITLGTSRWTVPATASALGASLGWRDNRKTAVTMDGAGLSNQQLQSTSLELPTEFTIDDKFNLVASDHSNRVDDDDDDDDDADDDDDDDADDDTKSLKKMWNGKVTKSDGSFAGTLSIPAGFSNGLLGGAAAASGVLVQDEAWGTVTGCGLIKVPASGVRGSFRTAAFVLGQ